MPSGPIRQVVLKTTPGHRESTSSMVPLWIKSPSARARWESRSVCSFGTSMASFSISSATVG
jgi:hypothetical protein